MADPFQVLLELDPKEIDAVIHELEERLTTWKLLRAARRVVGSSSLPEIPGDVERAIKARLPLTEAPRHDPEALGPVTGARLANGSKMRRGERRRLLLAALSKESEPILGSELAEKLGWDMRDMYPALYQAKNAGYITKDEMNGGWRLVGVRRNVG